MSGRDDNMTGILSRNARRQTDRQPEFKGECTIGGRSFWISAWVNQRRDDGGKFFKLAFTEKQPAAGAGPRPAQVPGAEIDDALPFAPAWE